MPKYTIDIPGEEYWNPADNEIEAHDIHHACRIARKELANPNTWCSGATQFTATVVISGPNSTVTMPVECCVDNKPKSLTEQG